MARANNYEDPRSKRKYYKTVKDGKTQYSRQVRIGNKKLWTPFFPSTKKVEEYIIQESSKKEEQVENNKHLFMDIYKEAFSEMQKAYIEQGRSPSALSKFSRSMDRYVVRDVDGFCAFKDKFIEDITIAEVKKFKNDINNKYKNTRSKSLITGIFQSVDKVFKYATECGYLSNMFMVEIKVNAQGKKQKSRNAVRNFLSGKEFEEFLETYDACSLEYFLSTRKKASELEASYFAMMFRTFFMLVFYTGARLSEARGLKWDKIIEPVDEYDSYSLKLDEPFSDRDAKLIKKQAFTSKMKTDESARIVYMHDKLTRQLFEYRDFLKKNGFTIYEYVFTNCFSYKLIPVDEKTIDRTFRHFIIKTKIEETSPEINGIKRHITIHGMRHSACANLLELGMDKKAVANFLGHSTTLMVDYVYGHFIKPTDMALEDRKANLRFFRE